MALWQSMHLVCYEGIILKFQHISVCSQAIHDNDKIWGTIVTACNQDGHENSPITAPAEIQQIKLLEKIYNRSGVDPGSVQYIEAHGMFFPF
jgi:acyl transferase domain-containing protein